MNTNPAVWILGPVGLIVAIPILVVLAFLYLFFYPFLGTTDQRKPA